MNNHSLVSMFGADTFLSKRELKVKVQKQPQKTFRLYFPVESELDFRAMFANITLKIFVSSRKNTLEYGIMLQNIELFRCDFLEYLSVLLQVSLMNLQAQRDSVEKTMILQPCSQSIYHPQEMGYKINPAWQMVLYSFLTHANYLKYNSEKE